MTVQYGDVFYTPPPFRVCPECDGKKTILSKSIRYEGYAKEITCPGCNGTGRIPIYYTIERWEELTGRKVPDDMPVWYYISPCLENDFNETTVIGPYCEFKDWRDEFDGGTWCVIATEAGRPPKDWRKSDG